ncbi:perforin-1-like [Leuresthes tenuis]|uniref:perforin-1-like n=1 Tax=Leuresthes tenuis TaxID=355514 RepID=UPI003B511172
MAKLWQLLLLCWAWSPPCLPSSVSFIGTPQECKKAHFVPGYNLGGEGFDIVTVERKGAAVVDTESWKLGNGTCRLYVNKYVKGKKQKVPAAVVDWRILPQCSLKVDSVVYHSPESLANESTSAVSSDWKTGLNLSVDPSVIYGGTKSREWAFVRKSAEKDRYTFFRHSVSCNLYRYRLTAKPPLSREFQSAVNSLPSYSNKTKDSYRALVDTYGTHYTKQVILGGVVKAITAVKTCEATLNGLSATEINDCLTVEASASFTHPDIIKALMQYCKKKARNLSIPSFNSMFSERETVVTGGNVDGADILFQAKSDPSLYSTWLRSLKTTPDVVQYSLNPLHTILPAGHRARAGLKLEVEKYIERNALRKVCSETCKFGHRSNKREPCACVCQGNQNLKSNCCPAGKGLATLRVFGLSAKGLYGDRWTKTDGSVEVKYGDQIRRTAIITNNDNPKWSETFDFGPIDLNSKTKLIFSVYDEDTYWNSDLLGRCSFVPHSGNVTDSCMFTHGTFFFSYEVKCAPSLGGQQCQDYMPTPATSTLTAVLRHKNWVLLGRKLKYPETF